MNWAPWLAVFVGLPLLAFGAYMDLLAFHAGLVGGSMSIPGAILLAAGLHALREPSNG